MRHHGRLHTHEAGPSMPTIECCRACRMVASFRGRGFNLIITASTLAFTNCFIGYSVDASTMAHLSGDSSERKLNATCESPKCCPVPGGRIWWKSESSLPGKLHGTRSSPHRIPVMVAVTIEEQTESVVRLGRATVGSARPLYHAWRAYRVGVFMVVASHAVSLAVRQLNIADSRSATIQSTDAGYIPLSVVRTPPRRQTTVIQVSDEDGRNESNRTVMPGDFRSWSLAPVHYPHWCGGVDGTSASSFAAQGWLMDWFAGPHADACHTVKEMR